MKSILVQLTLVSFLASCTADAEQSSGSGSAAEAATSRPTGTATASPPAAATTPDATPDGGAPLVGDVPTGPDEARDGVGQVVDPETAASDEAPKPKPVDPETVEHERIKAIVAAFPRVDAAAAAKLITDQPAIKVLDVRTPREFAKGHLSGAQNLDILVSSFAKLASGLDPTAHYLVHSQAGRRSESALYKLAKLGFAKVTHLDGGFEAWEAAGQPVDK